LSARRFLFGRLLWASVDTCIRFGVSGMTLLRLKCSITLFGYWGTEKLQLSLFFCLRICIFCYRWVKTI
jgi:hypothetical protein